MRYDERALRLVRGAVVGVGAVALGAAGHAVAAGMLPDPGALPGLTALAVVVGVCLSGRQWSPAALLLVLGGGQVVVHAVLGGAHDGMSAGMHAAAMSPGMLLAHVVATGLSARLLARADSWALGVVALLTTLGGALLAMQPAVVPATRPRAATLEVPVLLRQQWWIGSQQRRGPPTFAAC